MTNSPTKRVRRGCSGICGCTGACNDIVNVPLSDPRPEVSDGERSVVEIFAELLKKYGE